MLQLLFLFAAGFFGGVINSIAGDGSFITFPALLLAGITIYFFYDVYGSGAAALK